MAKVQHSNAVLVAHRFALVAAVGIWLSVLAYHFAPQWKPKQLDRPDKHPRLIQESMWFAPCT